MVVPTFRIQNDVSPGRVQVAVISYDGLVIISLPNVSISFPFDDPFGGVGFEHANDGAEGIAQGTPESSGYCIASFHTCVRRCRANNDDAVHMIRHDNESVESDVPEMEGNLAPAFTNDLPSIRQPYLSVGDRTENGRVLICANRDKVRALSTIVVMA
ncbi:MAG: hypothetical protein DMD48_10175 [Gemmatimonadetes bacterium]|nr:MAG: hypothetical protein DMD48_10175 [Gemmatimonadota bacterium]